MESKLLELSVGLAAAAIIINIVLGWVLKWRERQTANNCRNNILHHAQTENIYKSIERQEELLRAQTTLLHQIKDSGDRRERLLAELLSALATKPQ